MKTTDEWMAETMQPIIDRIAGDKTPPKQKPDALSLIHPSLGLAFTAEFAPRDLGVTFVDKLRPLSFMDAFAPNKAADALPVGCDGCRVDLFGTLICCVNQGEEE